MSEQPEASKHSRPRHTEGLERLLAFSDGVFSIAITLLVLEIHLPKLEGQLSNQQLLDTLFDLWPKLFAYLTSFGVVAIFWVKHHVTFRYIKAYDAKLVVLNLLLLLVVSFIPFPASVLAEQHNGVATILYAGTMAAGFLLSAWIWSHATDGNRLVATDFDPQHRQSAIYSSLAAAAVFALSAVIAVVDWRWARLSWLLLIPASNSRLWAWGKR